MVTDASIRRLQLFPPRLRSATLFFISALILAITQSAFANERIAQLRISADRIALLGDEKTLLIVANEAQRIMYFDLTTMSVVAEVKFSESTGSVAADVKVTDVVVDWNDKFAYLVASGASDKTGVVMRLEIGTHELRRIAFSERVLAPSIAVDRSGSAFISDLNSGTVTIVDSLLFERIGEKGISRSELPRNVYLKYGPAADIAVSNDGQFAFAAQHLTSIVALIDVAAAEAVDEVGWSDERRDLPFSITVLEDTRGSDGPARVHLFLTDIRERVAVLTSLDRDFGTLDVMGQLAVDILDERVTSSRLVPPMLIAANPKGRRVVVGNQLTNLIALFELRGFGDASFIERKGTIALEQRPLDVVISAAGNLVIVLGSDHRSLWMLDYLGQPDFAADADEGSQSVREIQEQLAKLGYPVGGVDGFDGPWTRRAIMLFQKEHNLQPDGLVTPQTLEALQAVAAAKEKQQIQ